MPSLPKNDVKLNQFGFRQGGPIVIPKLYDGRGKAFFFFNYEEMRLPNNFTRTRTILTPDAQAGIFRWDVTVNDQRVIRERNLFDLVGPAGHPIALDPIANQILNNIRSASGTTGLVTQNTNPNTMSFQWQSPGYQYEKQPVLRIDYNLTSSHRLSGTYNWQVVSRDPDQLNGGDNRFPGAQNYSHYISYRPLASVTLRSTLTPNIVNEARGGGRWGPGYFGQPHSNGPQTFEDQGGFALNLGLSDVGITNWHTQNGPSWRSAWSYEFSNTMNWQKGTHSLSLGGCGVLRQHLAPQPADGAVGELRRRPGRSGEEPVQLRQFPGRQQRRAGRRAGVVRCAHGPRDQPRRQYRPRREHEPIRLPRPAAAGRQAERVLACSSRTRGA